MIQRARTLHEALPYIRKFSGKTIVIKYGGHAMVDPELRASFARDIVLLKYVGMNPVVVHGGGPQINDMLGKLGIESKFHNGLRITDDSTMQVVEMVLGGTVNKEIVTLINHAGGKAVGLTGKDAGLLQATAISPDESGGVSIGQVGTVKQVQPKIISVLENQGFIPVVAPVGVDEDGKSYNINADYVACEIAAALDAEKLIMMTDVDGVRDQNEDKMSVIDRKTAESMKQDGTIHGGMIPKVDCALKALDHGVRYVHIINGTVAHALLLELFTDEGIGTMFEKNTPYASNEG